ncbi:MAG TPA: hypothetical protein VL354_16510 [Spirochaetia bacterium]|nr:hypothetical protein [Spirochaetia bacterium]
MIARVAKPALVAGLLLAVAGLPVFALQGEIDVDAVPSAALAPMQGPGSQLIQAEATRLTSQFAVSGQTSPIEDLTLSGTTWLLLDSLPSYNPLAVPGTRLALSSRVFQADASWQIIPGTLIWDTGKQIIHPSSGFFRAPLNLMSRGAAGNVPQQIPAAAPQWEEGWIGTRLLWIVGDISFEEFFAPRLVWSSDVDAALGYLSAQQNDFMNQVRVQAHVGGVDLQVLALVSAGGPGSADPALHAQGGVGVDANVGDRLTVRGELSLADSLSRLAVVDPVLLSTSSQSVPWVIRALAGLTWSITTKTSLIVEYAYDGLGFAGSDYANVIQYSRNRLENFGSVPDVLGQFGSFRAAQHYGFARLAENITDQLTAQGWIEVNVQDPSAMDGIGLAVTNDGWGLSGSITNTWGGSNSEAGASAFLWQLDIELKLFF